MKKLLAVILVLSMVFALASCGGKEVNTIVQDEVENEEVKDVVTDDEKSETKPEVKPETKPEAKPEVKPEVKPQEKPETKPEEVPEKKPEVNKPTTVGQILLSDFNSLATDSASALTVAGGLTQNAVFPFSLATMEVEEGYLGGFDADITGFKEGAMFGPVIGTLPFVGYVFTLEDGADVNAFISTLKSNANLRWNICTQADEMTVGSKGNKVFFVMCNKTFDEE